MVSPLRLLVKIPSAIMMLRLIIVPMVNRLLLRAGTALLTVTCGNKSVRDSGTRGPQSSLAGPLVTTEYSLPMF